MITLQNQVKQALQQSIKQSLGIEIDIAKIILKLPPQVSWGDFCFECFILAKQLNKSPQEIAQKIASNLKNDILETSNAIGPYVNLKIKNEILFKEILQKITQKRKARKTDKPKTIMVEYVSPNTNKPLHLGHLRNGALGIAMINILRAGGDNVLGANLVNDRGVHICKSMLAWQKWANSATPKTAKEKGDHFVGKWYVRYNQEEKQNPLLKNEIREMLKKWEQGDKRTIALWKKMNNWVYDGFKKTYRKFGLKFDVFFYESQTYKLGKNIVEDGLEKGLLQKEPDGSLTAALPGNEFGLTQDNQPKKITLIRADGTSVYITQDLGTAVKKFKKYKLDQSIYVVGSEQDYHFQCLFWLLGALGFNFAKNCFHLSYGMVYLPDGKMKSREGKVVDADNLISQMEQSAIAEIKKRDKNSALSSREIKSRAEKIAIGAIKFYLLLSNPKNILHFDPAQSLSFDGKTGPYCQYAYARAKCLLSKAKNLQSPNKKTIDFGLLGKEEELALLRAILGLKQALAEAADNLNPSGLANQTYGIACAFNQFYQALPVINTNETALSLARLTLVKATAIALKQGLNLLGIDVLEKM